MKEYKVKFLSNFEFDNLPYKYVSKDDIGLADKKSRTAFVRRSGIPVMDQFVAVHEIEHLIEKNMTHTDLEGIAHKKGGAARNILPTILGGLAYMVNPALGAAVGALSNIGMQQHAQAGHPEQLGQPGNIGSMALQGLSGGLSGYGAGSVASGAIKGATAAGTSAATSGILGRTAGAVKGALGFAPASASSQITPGISTGAIGNVPVSGTLKGITSTLPEKIGTMGAGTLGFGLGTGLASAGNIPAAQTLNMATPTKIGLEAGAPANNASFGGQQYDFSKGLTTTPVTETQAALPQGMQTAGAGLGTGSVGGEVASNVSSKTPMLEKLLGANWKQTVLGASIPLLGQSAGSMFGASPTPEPFSAEQSALFNETANMVRQGAQVQLNPAQTQSITAQYDTALDQARQNIMDRYKMLRPGSDIENDSNLKQAMVELESDFAEKKANALASAQLGLGVQQTQMMAELANMEIYTLAQKAGISYAQASDFKKMLSSLGYMVSGQQVMYSK